MSDRAWLDDWRETVAAIEEVQARGTVRGDVEPSDGPPEPCIAAVDLLAMADEEEARWTRWREGELWTTS